MQIKRLWLYNFRNYNQLDIDFSDNTNLIIGDNGAGKTNILEAVYYLSTSKSFRNSPDREIKNWNSDNEFALEGLFATEDGNRKIKIQYKNGKKELYIDDFLESKVSNIVGKILVVPFLFDDIYLISGSPARRRAFVDEIISMIDENYFRNLRNYILAVRQKNSLLKNERFVNKELIKVWNERISDYAGYIIYKRNKLIEYFNFVINNLKERLYLDRGLFSIKYRSVFENINNKTVEEIKDRIIEILNRNVDKEIIVKNCLTGPHRDDFIIYKDNFTVKKFGSIGEARITSIILKKCQIEYYKKFRESNPILMIDDVFLELDRDIRKLAVDIIGDEFQILITTTSKENIPENLEFQKVFYISNGSVVNVE